MMFKASVTSTEGFEIQADTEDEARIMILEDLSSEQQANADIELEEIKKECFCCNKVLNDKEIDQDEDLCFHCIKGNCEDCK